MHALPVLMAVRIKGRASADAVAAAAGITSDAAREALDAARAAGLVQPAVAPGEPSGTTVALTPAGHAELRVLLAQESHDRAALARAYDGFAAVDGRVKEAVTGWQLAAPSGGRVAERALIGRVGEEAGAVAARLAALLPRYARYRQRLAAATAGWAGGDDRYAASPRVDSLHQVWFELHQDLLLTLGRGRET